MSCLSISPTAHHPEIDLNQGDFEPQGRCLGGVFGCHNWDCSWHLVGGGQGYCETSNSAEDSTPCKEFSSPNVNSAEVETSWSRSFWFCSRLSIFPTPTVAQGTPVTPRVVLLPPLGWSSCLGLHSLNPFSTRQLGDHLQRYIK